MDHCVFCHDFANMQCQRCHDFYCSPKCQVADWKNHKFICVSMPALVRSNQHISKKEVRPEPNMNISSDNQRDRQYVDLNVSTPMRLPHFDVDTVNLLKTSKSKENITILQTALKDNENIVTSMKSNNPQTLQVTCHNNKDARKVENINSNFIKSQIHDLKLDKSNEIKCVSDTSKNFDSHPKLKANSVLKENDCESVPVDGMKNVSITPVKEMKETNGLNLVRKTKSIDENSFETSRSNKKIWKTLRTCPSDFFNALVQYVDTKANIIWISDESWSQDLIKLLSDTNRDQKNFLAAPLKDMYFGATVIAPFEDIYYRAVIVEEVNPLNEVRIRLLDYGNDFFINCTKIKQATPITRNVPAMAIAVKYTRPVKIGQVVKIRIIKKEANDVHIVEEMSEDGNIIVEEQPLGDFEITKESILNIVDEFEINIFHVCSTNITKAFGRIYSKNLLDHLKKLTEILNSSKELYYNLNDTNVKSGYYVAAKDNEKWRRAIILAQYKNNYLVFFIDSGSIRFVSQIKLLPKEFKLIPSLTVCVELTNVQQNAYQIFESNRMTVKITKKKSSTSTLDCDLYNGNNIMASCSLSYFDGNYTQTLGSDLYDYPLIPGDKVTITNVINTSTIYIAPSKLYKYYDEVFDEIGKNPQTILEGNLKVNQIVLAKNPEKQKYVRASISTVLNESIYELTSLDSGEKFQTNYNCIKKGDNFVKLCPVLSQKVVLNILNIIKVPNKMNKALQSLQKYCSDGEEFILDWEKDLVELYFKSEKKISLNKQLIPLMYEAKDEDEEKNTINDINPVPSSKKKCLQLSDVEVIPIPTGENIRILILDTSDLKRGMITASCDNLEYYKKLLNEDIPSITEYCKRDDIEKEYCPSLNELCLSYFDEDKQWYRAFCIKVGENGKFKLMFLDFGNIQTIKKENIRKMNKTFMFPCYANTCILSDFPENCSESSIQKLNKILYANSLTTFDKVDKLQEQEYLITLNGIEECYST